MTANRLLHAEQNGRFYLPWGRVLLFMVLGLFVSATLQQVENWLGAEQTAVSTIPGKYDPTLAQGTEPVPVIIYLSQQTSINQTRLPDNKTERRQIIIEGLQKTAVSTQTPLLNLLTQQKRVGLADNIRPFWIINAVAATLDPNILPLVASLPSVGYIVPDRTFDGFAPPGTTALPHAILADDPTLPTWGVQHIGAPLAWEGLGVRGAGVVVAIMDSGVDWNHVQLHSNYRGLNADGTVDHRVSWYSPANLSLREPVDAIGHGTHVAGTAVGQGGIGVAPAARWIAVNITNAENLIVTSAVHAGFEWLLAPGGDPSQAPDIVNGSWTGAANLTLFAPDLAVLQAGGILPVFASGNTGPDPAAVGAPASYATVLAVGACNAVDAMVWFSSRGTSNFTNTAKPELMAPGTAVYSAYPHNQYRTFFGTSMATPHVSGAAALLLSANPALTPEEMVAVLTQTAVIPTTYTTTCGRLDAYAAVASQLTTGLLQGTFHADGEPLPAAAFTLTTPSGSVVPLHSTDNGQFSLPLLAGQYTITSATKGYSVVQIN
ncbi:MAG: S8 family serine peptidase, partial [Anaerolineales bacterium]|nr:S8 family serine peptidase [Anaerolineales bacterium]